MFKTKNLRFISFRGALSEGNDAYLSYDIIKAVRHSQVNIEIINIPFSISIYGFSGTALHNNYKETGFRLMDKMWRTVKLNSLAHKGLNVWIYDQNGEMFAGVELHDTPKDDLRLEHKRIDLIRYAYYKHIGPYSLLEQVGRIMKAKISDQSFETSYPYLEIYGHWTSDESQLETELLMHIK